MIRKIRRNKKGLSPVVASVLLIALVVAISLIVFLWLRGTVKEAYVKNDQNVQILCDSVLIRGSYLNKEVSVSNLGSITIANMEIKAEKVGSYETVKLTGFDGLFSGESKKYSFDATQYEKITLIPVLLGIGQDSGNQKEYSCENNGYEIQI